MVEIFQNALLYVSLAGLALSLVMLAARSQMILAVNERLLSYWSSLTPFGRIVAISFITASILYGGSKTNSPPRLMMVRPTSSTKISYAERKAQNWNIRGVWKDSFWLNFADGWRFPFGTNNLVTASLELFRNGDILFITNGISNYKERELPFPYDGFGQDDEWVTANFTNATEILSIGYHDWSDVSNGGGLGFSHAFDVSCEDSFSFFVQGEALSGYEEVEFECSFIPESGTSKIIREKMTVFACYTQPVENKTFFGYQVVNPSFLSPQSNAVFCVDVAPVDIPASKISWRTVAGVAHFPSGANGTQAVVRGISGMADIEVSVLGVSEENMHFKSKVIP